MSRGRVYQGIYSWKRVTVLRAGSIEVYEVYAHPPLSIGLFDHNHVCQLVRVVYFSNEICFYQGIYLWKWVTVLGAGSIEIREIYAHPSLSIGLFDHNYVCQLIRVVHFSNEICFQQLPNLLSYGFVSFRGNYSLFLLDG